MSDLEIGKSFPVQEIIQTQENLQTEDENVIFEKQEKSIKPDGIIDDFSQGYIGDCALLSTLISFKNSPKGSEIFKNAISETENGYQVNFKGLNKTYEITNDELSMASEGGYALGLNEMQQADADVVLMELAFEKACDENPSSRMEFKKFVKGKENYADRKSIESEYAKYFMMLLTGEKSSAKVNWLGLGIGNNKLLDKMQNSDFIACANFSSSSKDKEVNSQDGMYTLCTKGVGHAYAIKSIDDKNVTIVNPHSPDKDVIISREDFSKNVDEIHYLIFD